MKLVVAGLHNSRNGGGDTDGLGRLDCWQLKLFLRGAQRSGLDFFSRSKVLRPWTRGGGKLDWQLFFSEEIALPMCIIPSQWKASLTFSSELKFFPFLRSWRLSWKGCCFPPPRQLDFARLVR